MFLQEYKLIYHHFHMKMISKLVQVLLVVLVFGVINLPLVACWGWFGSAMRRFLQDPKKLKLFNWTMAILLVASLYPIVQPMFQG